MSELPFHRGLPLPHPAYVRKARVPPLGLFVRSERVTDVGRRPQRVPEGDPREDVVGVRVGRLAQMKDPLVDAAHLKATIRYRALNDQSGHLGCKRLQGVIEFGRLEFMQELYSTMVSMLVRRQNEKAAKAGAGGEADKPKKGSLAEARKKVADEKKKAAAA